MNGGFRIKQIQISEKIQILSNNLQERKVKSKHQ